MPAPTLVIPHVTHAPTLDDYATGRPREREVEITELRQWTPGDGDPASQPTKVYLSYDDKKLFVAFVAKDDLSKVRAHKTRRDDIGDDDYVCVNTDTFHDHRRDYFFCSNPLGIQMDGITTGNEDDLSFDTVWSSDARLVEDGFVVLITIPFRSLRFPGVEQQRWGISLGRAIIRNNETVFWPYITQRIPTFQTQFGHVEGIERVSPGRNFQINPYALFSASRILDTPPTGPTFRTGTDSRIGVDLKAVVRDAFTLDAAINPDFSQVESDEPQVAVNRRYEVYFPEKRPLFLENAAFFATPEQLFFSRRIIDPEVGARFTGKYGRWALGFLGADDRAPGQLLDRLDRNFGRHALNAVARVSREFASDSHFGMFLSTSQFPVSSNTVAAVDARLKLTSNWYFDGQVARSSTSNSGLQTNGYDYVAKLNHDNRHGWSHTSFFDRSPRFQAQLGFIPRVDVRQIQQSFGYSWRPERKVFLSYGPRLNALVNWDHAGHLQDWEVAPEFSVELPGQTLLGATHAEAFERYQEVGFRKRLTSFYASTQTTRWLALSSAFSYGTGINYYPAAGLSACSAKSSDGALRLTVRPSAQLKLEQTYLYTRLAETPYTTHVPGSPAQVVFSNHIVRSKANYQLSREMSFRLILDYNATLPNSNLVSLERSKRFGGDFLFTYLAHPGTAIYVGYTDIYENLLISAAQPQITRRAFPGTGVERQFFLKLSYLFRM
ncbi:MAG TPA: DUF5916 domain-containing protein [Terriglobales bacterium]|nr:DUF5916 domain-containing protein [Terriglobales bacterium]